MSPSKLYEPYNVVADIHYWFPGTEPIHGPDVTAADKKLGQKYDCSRTMTILDIRGMKDNFNIETHGFTVITLPEKERHEYDNDWVVNHLYEEYECVIKTLTGADVVIFFNHVQRRAGETIWNPALKDANKNGPSSYPHVDYCGEPTLLRNFLNQVSPMFPPEARSRLDTAQRTALFNVWKPIETVQRDPLAVGDVTSFQEQDYRLCINKLPDGSDHGNYLIAPEMTEPRHRWYYVHQQTKEELLVFREYDSDRSTPGWRCPHTAVRLPGSEHLPARQSIESRCVALWF